MLDQFQSSRSEIAESHKLRCPTDRSVQFFWVDEGLRYRCRHCKNEHIVTWEEWQRRYREQVSSCI